MGNTETSLRLGELEIDRSKEEVQEDWNVSPGKLRFSSVTVFSAVHPASSKKRPFMEKALQASKVYRHPGILRYMDGGILGSEIIVVMEEATPLVASGLENMSLLQIIAGLASIIEALVFLHDKAGVSHNNVCASSIYVTSEGIWKLWGLEYLCSFGELTRDHMERINQYCHEKSLPPDDKSRISPAYQHARDSFCFAKFIQDTILPVINTESALLSEFVVFLRSRALHREWTERPRLFAFCDHALFHQEFLKLRHDIANVLLLPLEQRDQFIRSLPSTLKNYSDDVVALTLGSLLLSHSFLLIPSSASHLMPALLTPKSSTSDVGLFSPSVFRESIVPLILQLFAIHDSAIRKILLSQFQHYSSLIPKDQLTTRILPQILLGIRDTDEELVASTLHSLAYLIPLLGADVVIGRNREQIFATAKPKTKPVGILKNFKKSSKRAAVNVPGLTPQSTADGVAAKAFIPLALDLEPSGEDRSLLIPERSSPDGGEMTDEDVFAKGKAAEGAPETASEDQWSDWEEMLDQPTPDIVGVLQVKPSEGDAEDAFPEDMPETRRNSSSGELEASAKGTAMQLRTNRAPKKTTQQQGLGEEYDIMSIKVEKKPDAERDLFADLAPKLKTKDYNLENMLIEASHKTREKLPSLSDTLAEMDITGVEEGDDWNEEGTWNPPEDLSDPKGECRQPDLDVPASPRSSKDQPLSPPLSPPLSLPLTPLLSRASKVSNIDHGNSGEESAVFDDGWGQDKWESF